MHHRIRGRIHRRFVMWMVGCAVALSAVALAPSSTSLIASAGAHRRAATVHFQTGRALGVRASAHDQPPTALDVALTGTATASTEASGSPASNAIDGDASTQWCSTQWTGNVTVDLGSVRDLNGFARQRRQHGQLPVAIKPGLRRLSGQPGRPGVVLQRCAVDRRADPAPSRSGTVLLGARVDSRRGVGAGRRLAQ